MKNEKRGVAYWWKRWVQELELDLELKWRELSYSSQAQHDRKGMHVVIPSTSRAYDQHTQRLPPLLAPPWMRGTEVSVCHCCLFSMR